MTSPGAAASPGQRLSSCSFTRRTKLSTVSFTDVVVVFTFDIVLNSCILNCFVFSLYMSSISFYLQPAFGFSESGHKPDNLVCEYILFNEKRGVRWGEKCGLGMFYVRNR